ncbi:MAG: malate dehydrogenase [Hadesarchaea archaeon DG-33-1]|nr:MAG: malate dehydrogenase [Hadesarchaea archaeon DG-33-1]
MTVSKKKLLAKANMPRKLALEYHPFYRGKLEVMPKVPVRTSKDFAIWYTPGVAAPCEELHKDASAVFDYTGRWNYVAVVSDGTRVLGLGDIGPEAGLPVMEGKALLFKYLGGVDAFPMCLDVKDPDELIAAVKWISPTFGGVNLEDISSPKCFHILERLREELSIPVWHDDQQGTALVTLAGLTNALKIVGKKLDEIKIAMIGSGAANISVYRYLKVAGANPGNVTMTDVKGMLTPERANEDFFKQVAKAFGFNPCEETNADGRTGGIPEAMKDADVCIAYSTPGPGVIKKEWVKSMADNAVIFACANPIPEIWPWEAEEAGAKIVATGRSDFPNQMNNSLGFPAVLRGALDVAAKSITDEMCTAAAYAVAEYAEEKGIHEKYMVPTMEETEMYIKEAVAVGTKAMEQGVARNKLSRQELGERASSIIKRAQEATKLLMSKKIILSPPE